MRGTSRVSFPGVVVSFSPCEVVALLVATLFLGMTAKMTNTTFLLKLGDGSGWVMRAAPGTRSWVEKFATIMKLKTHEQDRHHEWPRMFFLLRHPVKDGHVELANLIGLNTKQDLPKSGWKAHDLRSLRVWSHRHTPDIVCELDNEGSHELDIIRMWTVLYVIYLRVQQSGGFPLHAALVERDGKGVLLVGSGGSGKSTLCRRFPRPWYVLSDDQALIVRDGRKRYLAHPLPTWSDCLWQRSQRRWNVEHCVPLAAIFFIEQAKSEEVVPIGEAETAVFINRSSTDVCRPLWWNLSNGEGRKLKKKNFGNACQLARAIPAYILHISLTGRFWNEMEKVL